MSDNESLNFYKLSTLLLDIGKDVLSKRIQQECSNNSVSFEDFLNRLVNKDTLLHLWKSVKCCNAHCNKSRTKTILNNVQWNLLYTNSGAVGHVKRDTNGRICQECTCNYTACVGVVTDSLDVSLASCILLNLCTLMPPERKSIENLRELRNSVFAHAHEAKVSDADFCGQWQNIEREITILSSHFDSATKTRFDEKIKHLDETPFVDKEMLQSLLGRILLQYGQASCILEEMKDIAEEQRSCINRTPVHKIEKITQAETDAFDFIPTKAYEKGIGYIKRHGVAIFTGNSGSGKTTNALGILRQVKKGDIFEDLHIIQHINIDNWDSQVDIDLNSVVFLEDPLGTTNANTALTELDNGTFRKIWSCIQKGKVKVILTVRSNILHQNKPFLQRHDIFHETYIINLSDGECSLDMEEKKQIVELYCMRYDVNIIQDNIKNLDDINLETGPATPIQVGQSTIKEILKSDPQIGFPLCCRDFFTNRKNISLGARYFSQPSEIKLNEMKSLVASESESERCQFAVLIYMLMNNSTIDVNYIDWELLKEICQELGLTEKKNVHIRISLNTLNNRFISKCAENQSMYTFVHATVLESVFVSTCEEVPNLVSLLLSKVDIKVICELLKTENIEENENEVVVKIAKGNYDKLAERFIKEWHEKRFREIITHVSMSDNGFIDIFLSELKKCPNLLNNEGVYAELFSAACLFDKTNLVDTLLKTDFIYFDMILEGSMICTKFDNVKTFKTLIPKMLHKHLQKTLISSCKQGKLNILDTIITLANEAILPKHFEQGLKVACSFGNVEIVKYILSCGIENGCHKGFEEACGKGHMHIVKLLLSECRSLRSEEIVAGFVTACAFGHAGVGIFILPFLPTTYINLAIIEAMECCDGRTLTCLIGNKNMLSDENIRHCLSKVCNSKNMFRSKSTEHFSSTASEPNDCSSLRSFSNRSVISAPDQSSSDQNLFPEINSNFDWNSEDHFKAIFFKAILNSRPNFPKNDLIDIFIEASKNDLVEVACVIVKKVFNIHSQTRWINSILIQAYEAGHTDALDLIYSTCIFGHRDLRKIMLAICKKEDFAILRKLINTRIHDDTDIMIIAVILIEQGKSNLFHAILEVEQSLFAKRKYGLQLLNAASIYDHDVIIACLIDSFPDIPLQDILSAWNEMAIRSHFKSIQVLLEKRVDVPNNCVMESLHQAIFNGKNEFVYNVLTNRPDLPLYELFDLAKYAYLQGNREIFQMIVTDKCEFLLADILNLLDDLIEADKHNFFEIIIRKYSSIVLIEIGQRLTEQFMTKHKKSILDTLSEIHPELILDEIESHLLAGLQNRRNIKKISKELTEAVTNNDLTVVMKIGKYTDIPSKTLQNALVVASKCEVEFFEIMMEYSSRLTVYENYTAFIEICKSGNLRYIEIALKFCTMLNDEQISHGLMQICSVTEKMEMHQTPTTESKLELDMHNSKCLKYILNNRPNLSDTLICSVFNVALHHLSLEICTLILNQRNISIDDAVQCLSIPVPWRLSVIRHELNSYRQMETQKRRITIISNIRKLISQLYSMHERNKLKILDCLKFANKCHPGEIKNWPV